MRVAIKELEGRDHFVVPMVMITVGVHAGSQGPVFYPADELRRSVTAWNGKPVVVYHPEMYGGPFAGNPTVFSRQKVGYVFNTRFDGNRLKAEAWLDVERVRRVDPRVLQAIQNQKMMEVSTGLVIDEPGQSGIHNGKQYGMTARALRPDHLAILPDKKGACSIADGAGLLRNQKHQETLSLPVMAF